MKRRRRSAAGIAMLMAALAFHPAGADAQAPSAGVEQHIRDLAAPTYRERLRATQALRAMESRAVAPLRAAVQSKQLEVRLRASQLLREIEAAEFRRQVQAFTEPAGDLHAALQLPGWKRFQDLVGDDSSARELFAKMLQAEPELFRVLAQDPDHFPAAYESRCIELHSEYGRRRQQGSDILGSVCAMLFLGCDKDVPVSERAAGTVFGFTHYNDFRQAMGSGPRVAPLRRLLAGWVARPGGVAAYQRTRVALQHDLPEGLIPAVEVISDGGPAWHLQYAALAVAKLGNREHVPILERLLANETVLNEAKTTEEVVFCTQLRDVALAALLHLTEQDPADFGFEKLRSNSYHLFEPNTAGFKTDAQRTAAFEKWNLLRDRFAAPQGMTTAGTASSGVVPGR